jgi:hypothetical protein
MILYDIGSIGGIPKEWRNEDIDYIPFEECDLIKKVYKRFLR